MPIRSPFSAVLSGATRTPALRSACAALCAALALAGCNLQEDPAQLTARTSASAVQGARCMSCHQYPLQDTNHVYHLYHTTGDKHVNGSITCMDCHSMSIQYTNVVLQDSFWHDTTSDPVKNNPGTFSSLDRPTSDPTDSLAPIIRTYHLDSVIARPQRHPIPLPKQRDYTPSLTEYMTGLAHMNGQVDVVFDPRVSDTARYGGAKADYNPQEETCSAVACHPSGPNIAYRFAAPSKGLSELKN
jgi:hypothetical protein